MVILIENLQWRIEEIGNIYYKNYEGQ